ncbi:hypothetical protein M2399_002592 [Pseudomonas sp. BIGb0450]|uniref:hypothetical protein n=1 Tax=unclassified Pseudomonas TaxID=196821 RepID=UPI00216A1945|nr:MULTISPECIES: hypothetical protein [unclassified Pseudomonas]MCS3417138.1 hypothetical protein [Pseudomonas sp. BIGb0558]MCS3437155.1 hypothetical protein [Pseudomonas sp. BIGb0450]
MTDKQNPKDDDDDFDFSDPITSTGFNSEDEPPMAVVADEKDFDFDFDEEVSVNMEDTYIEMHHRIGDKTINLRYCGRTEEITCYSWYTQEEFAAVYPQIDTRVISSIASVFIELRYYGHDFHSGDFQAILKNWLEEYVFNNIQRTNVEMTKYLIEKETKSLFDELSKIRMYKCNEPHELQQFTPIRWATPEQIKKHYDHLVRCGHFKSGE